MCILRTEAGRITDREAERVELARTGRGSHRPRAVTVAKLLLAAVAIFTWATCARSQVLYGSLVGNVTDSQGAVVPGAKVEVTNVSTSGTRNAMTDDRGAYVLNDLQVGVYKIAISRASFKTLLKEDFRVQANKGY